MKVCVNVENVEMTTCRTKREILTEFAIRLTPNYPSNNNHVRCACHT